jgi:hypothetical protein
MADPRERRSVHALMVGGMAAVVAAVLVIVYFLDHPYGRHIGSIQPSAMRHTLVLIRNLEPGLRPACSDSGRPI